MEKQADPIKSILRVTLVTAALLLVPYLAMRYNWQVPEPGGSQSSAVNWTLGDFLVMGTLLMGVGLTYELGIKKVSGRTHRILLAVALAIAFLLIWAELAVGVFGTPFAGN